MKEARCFTMKRFNAVIYIFYCKLVYLLLSGTYGIV